MTAMVQEFGGVRELSMEEVDAVVGGGPWGAVLRVRRRLSKVAGDTATGQAMIEGVEAAGNELGEAAQDAYSRTPQGFQQGVAMISASQA